MCACKRFWTKTLPSCGPKCADPLRALPPVNGPRVQTHLWTNAYGLNRTNLRPKMRWPVRNDLTIWVWDSPRRQVLALGARIFFSRINQIDELPKPSTCAREKQKGNWKLIRAFPHLFKQKPAFFWCDWSSAHIYKIIKCTLKVSHYKTMNKWNKN
jgi:hypothetical protein